MIIERVATHQGWPLRGVPLEFDYNIMKTLKVAPRKVYAWYIAIAQLLISL